MTGLVLVIDTSSARSAVALVAGNGAVEEMAADSGRAFDTGAAASGLLRGRVHDLAAVAIALGPGSFTGLRAGISFGLGVAVGLQVPLLGLGTLQLVAARTREPVTALSEAGRGRVYYLSPDGRTGVGTPAEIPGEWPIAGWTRTATAAALVAAGHQFLEDGELLSFGAAAATLLEGAERVAYDRVRAAYMSPFGGLI